MELENESVCLQAKVYLLNFLD